MKENHFFLSLLILFYCFDLPLNVFADLERYNAYVHNALPDNSKIFTVHVFSGNSDFKYHTPKVGESFFWTFKMNIFRTTKFFGHFWWGNDKEQKFVVFDNDMANKYCRSSSKKGPHVCWWQVQEDGFYIANKTDPGPNDLQHMNGWEFRM